MSRGHAYPSLPRMPILVCHDEVVVECDAEQAPDAKAWLQKAMIEGMDNVLNGTGEVRVPVIDRGRDCQLLGTGIGTGQGRQAQTTQSHRILSPSRPGAYTDTWRNTGRQSRAFIRTRHSRKERDPVALKLRSKILIPKDSLGRTRFKQSLSVSLMLVGYTSR